MVPGSHFLDTLWVSYEYEILLLCTIIKDPKSSNSKRFDLGYPAVSWDLKPYAKFHDVFTGNSLTFALQTDLKIRKHESWSFPRGLLSKQSYLFISHPRISYLPDSSVSGVNSHGNSVRHWVLELEPRSAIGAHPAANRHLSSLSLVIEEQPY